ncbi:MAG: hypothetical protein ACTS4U_00245 [Candidatus Hodgkinia cicadicola]
MHGKRGFKRKGEPRRCFRVILSCEEVFTFASERPREGAIAFPVSWSSAGEVRGFWDGKARRPKPKTNVHAGNDRWNV